ncbi:hypothetical protein Tco_1397412 [Tanacetum coccineum]
MWGMFYRANVGNPELIWEDFAFQIDHRKERKSRRKNMPFPQFIKVIINHFLSQHKSLSKLQFQHYHTLKDDGIVSRLKFIIIGEDYQEYGLPIPDMMLNHAIKRSESYQMFLKYSSDVDVSEESDSEPARKKTASRRVVKKKVTISAVDNIIPDPDVSLELGKSISLTKAAEEEAARQVYATHARIVTEFMPEPAKKKSGSRRTRGVVIQDTHSAPKPKPATSKLKLKGVQSLTPEEQEAADIIKYSEEDQGDDEEVDWIDSDEDEEKKDDTDDDKSINLEMTDDEETDDEFVHGVEQVNDDEDEEMTNAEVEESGNDDEENTDAVKMDAGKIEEVKDDTKKAELPPTSSNLSVSSSFNDQFLKLSFDTSLVSTVKDTTDAEIKSLLDIKIQYELPHIQSSSILRVPVFLIFEPSILSPVQETPSVAPVTTLSLPHVSTIPHVPHQTNASIPTPPIITDDTNNTTVVPESNALSAV